MTRDPIRPLIRSLAPSGITQVTALGLGNPDVLPLWFGETDLATPPFIRQAAAGALEDGKTFYTNARGIQPLREAIRDFHKRTAGADIPIERITVPGGAMLAVVTALQMVCEANDNVVIVSPIWPNIFQATKVVGAEPRLVRLDERLSPDNARCGDHMAAHCRGGRRVRRCTVASRQGWTGGPRPPTRP